ncbi:MAG: TonB-dependent receptor domain-containing protein [Woeseia sp.]
MSGLLAAGLGLTSEKAIAQADDEGEAHIEEITVTGSRIQRGNLTQPNPVYGLDAEDVKLSGETNLIDIVDDLPQLFSSDNSAQSTFFTQGGINNTPGLARLDLRGLGANRTLVLVDGKRHVSGQAGSAAVDIGSIPSSLVDRVEVLTGGASSIYGADAVSGVVNFITKDNFEGTEIDLQGGISDEGGGDEVSLSLTHGLNFQNNRGNITVNISGRKRSNILYGDRDWSRDSGIAGRQNSNWRRFFQLSDSLPPGASVGEAITTGSGASCAAVYPGTDQGLVTRACSAAPSAIERHLRFGLTSPNGLFGINLADDITAATPVAATGFPLFHTAVDLADLAPGTPVMDFNNNGIDDCTESVMGDRAVGGCVVVDSDGTVRPFDPGLLDGDFLNFDAIGGDGSPQAGADDESLDPGYEAYSVNVLLDYEISDNSNFFADFKYVNTETTTQGGTIAFFDTINLSPENPFVPQPMANLMNQILALNPQFANTAQFFMTRDPEDIHNNGIWERETFRIVTGFEGDFWDDWTYELAFNFGTTEEDGRDQALLNDRWFAALDVVADASGNAVCRSEVEAGWTVDDLNNDSIFGDSGVNTFTPGDGTCRPANPFGGGLMSQEAQDFIAPWRTRLDEIDQTLVSFVVTGDTDRWFSLPGGPIGLAGGVEYRKETSESIPDAFEEAGYYFNSQTSPIVGELSVKEIFVEISAPLLSGVTGAQELTVDAAYRYSDYDLVVDTTDTWSAGISWAPIDDLRVRGTVSRAVRAPNIFELFSPQTRTIFNLDIDPCDQNEIDALAVSDPATAANRTANCAADPLVGPNFINPLTSNFPGVTGGNPNLNEEESDTTTVGLVFTPRFVEGLTVTVDYWDIEIEEAISTIDEEDILRGCYDGPALDPTFCSLFTRESDPTSGFFGGLRFLQTGQVNFAALETSGVDTELTYDTDLFGGNLRLRANVTFLNDLTEFRSALEPTLGDVETGEILLPEWSGNISARWGVDDLTFDYHARYVGNQAHRQVEESSIASFDNPTTGVLWIHDLSASWVFSDRYSFYGGLQNFTDEQPFDTQPSFPTGIRGRYLFLGVTAAL